MAIAVRLSSARPRGRDMGMNEGGGKATREERLAAKLRENLRRRKAQARALEGNRREPLSKEKPNS